MTELKPVPLGRSLRKKGRLHGRTLVLESEWWGPEPHIGCPSLGVLHREQEPTWLAGGLLGLAGALLEAWTSLPLMSRARWLSREGRLKTALVAAGFPRTALARASA